MIGKDLWVRWEIFPLVHKKSMFLAALISRNFHPKFPSPPFFFFFGVSWKYDNHGHLAPYIFNSTIFNFWIEAAVVESLHWIDWGRNWLWKFLLCAKRPNCVPFPHIKITSLLLFLRISWLAQQISLLKPKRSIPSFKLTEKFRCCRTDGKIRLF